MPGALLVSDHAKHAKRPQAGWIIGGAKRQCSVGVQGLAIASMHYTGMAATYFVPLGINVEIDTPMFGQRLLAYIIAFIVVCVGNLGMIALAVVQRQRPA